MSNDRHVDAKSAEPTGRKFSFTVPMRKGRGVWLVEGQWRYEGAELELARELGKIAADMWCEGKLWWDGEAWQTGPRRAPVPPLPSKLDAALLAFNASRNTEKLELLLRSIGSAVAQMREYSSSIAEAAALEAVENDMVEDLLGSALLSCQAHMNALLLRIEAIKPLVRRRKSVRNTLLAEGHRTRELLQLPTPRMIGSCSLFEVVWALADYYKEGDQWPPSWTDAKGSSKRTISIMSAAGITEHTPHKLEAGVRVIGVSQYERLDLLGVICDHWGNVLSANIGHALGV